MSCFLRNHYVRSVYDITFCFLMICCAYLLIKKKKPMFLRRMSLSFIFMSPTGPYTILGKNGSPINLYWKNSMYSFKYRNILMSLYGMCMVLLRKKIVLEFLLSSGGKNGSCLFNNLILSAFWVVFFSTLIFQSIWSYLIFIPDSIWIS